MKLDMKSSGKGVTLANSTRRFNDKIEISAPTSKRISNSTRSGMLKNLQNSAMDTPHYESTLLSLNNIRNVDANRTLSSSRNLKLNRPLSNMYNVDSSRTLGNVSTVDSKRTLNNANYNLINISNGDPSSTLNNIGRTLSIDTALDTVMSEKERLKRQRRFCSQDEPDDPIERLNRLKALISGALSEVKGVLKQYSVDSEDIECSDESDANNKTIKDVKVAETPEILSRGPIQFRFIRKIHSRSSFTEEDDEEDDKVMPKSFQDLDASNIKVERKFKLNKTNEQLNNLKAKTTINKNNFLNSIQNDSSPKSNTESVASMQMDSKLKITNTQNMVEHSDISENKENLKYREDITELSASINENDKYAKSNENKNKVENKNGQFLNATMTVPTIAVSPQTSSQNNNEEITILPESLAKGTLSIIKETDVKDNDRKNEANVKDKIENKTNAIPETIKTENTKKPKRKLISKNKEIDRRASVSCVDSSQLSTLSVPAQIKRRPSDSEAIIKKKSNDITNRATSGIAEEVMYQVKNSTKKTIASAAQEGNKKSMIAMKHVNNSKVNESEVNAKASRTLNYHSSDILIPTKATIAANTTNSTELMPKQIPINETFNDRSIMAIEKPLIATTATAKATNETSNKMAINLQENNTEIKKCSTKEGEAIRQRKTNTLQEMSTNFHDSLNIKDAIIEKMEKNITIKTENVINDTEKQKSKQVQIVSNSVKTECQSEQLDVEKSMRKRNDDDELVKTNAAIKVAAIDNDNAIKTTKLNNALNQKQTNATVVISNLDSGTRNGYLRNTNHQITNNHFCPRAVISSCEANIQQQHTTTDIYQKEITIEATQATATTTATTAAATTNQNSTLSLDPLDPPCSQLLVNTQNNEMPEQQIATAPVQTTKILIDDPNNQKTEVNEKIAIASSKCENDKLTMQDDKLELIFSENGENIVLSESQAIAEEIIPVAPPQPPEPIKPKKERKIKKKVIIRRQKRRLSVTDSFFQSRSIDETTIAAPSSDTETLEKPIAFVTDDEDDKCNNEKSELLKKPLKSCMKVKEYEIGDEVLYPERFKKTQVRWKRGKIKERITSISYLIDIDGKEMSSHVNYLKKYTNRKVKFSGKEYLEIDYEQLAEEEEKAETESLRQRAQSIWNMV